MERAVEVYGSAHPGHTVHVAASIGSSGAVRAVADGAVDVGLLSRPLRDDERALGLVDYPLPTELPHAVVASGADPASTLTRAELIDLLLARRQTWPDGSPAVVLLRESSDSGNQLIRAHWPEVGQAIDAALAAGYWFVCHTDQEMRDELLRIPGALGFLDTLTIRLESLPLRPLEIDGVAPSDLAWPLDKRLSLLTGPSPSPAAEQLVRFVLPWVAEGGIGSCVTDP